MLAFIVSALALSGAAFLQTTSVLIIGFVKPNIVLALLAVLAHEHKSWTERLFLVLIPAFVLKFSPLIGWPDVIFIVSALLTLALVDYLPWRKLLNSLSATAVGTLAVNLYSFNVTSVSIELFINLILVVFFFVVVELINEKKATKQKGIL